MRTGSDGSGPGMVEGLLVLGKRNLNDPPDLGHTRRLVLGGPPSSFFLCLFLFSVFFFFLDKDQLRLVTK